MKKLREYQKDAIVQLRSSLKAGNKKVLLSLATGAGKSLIIREIVKMAEAKNNNSLMLAHRTILIKQMIETLSDCNNVAVETIQTSKNRLHDNIKIVILDEAHFGANSPMQDKVLSKYPNAIIIGLSATPITSKGERLEGWNDVIDVVQLKDLVDLGFASPVKVLAPMSIDRSHFKTVGGDYNQKDVGEEVTKSSIISDVVQKYIKHAHGLKSVFYAVNIEHAELIVAELTAEGYNASSYHSKLKNKDIIFKDFKDNKVDILVSVESLTTGVDVSNIYCAVLATPTKSIIKAVQIYGRITRLDPKNPDKVALILDCSNVIDDTVHPYQKLDFTKEPTKKVIKCKLCDGTMKVIKKTASIPNERNIYYVETVSKCDKCGNIDIKSEEKIDELTFCEECEEHIKKGTAKTITEIDEGNIIVYSECPHCKHKKVFRELESIDAELEEKLLEVQTDSVETWEDLHKELRKAKDKYGKKYHHFWARRVIETLQNENFTVDEVKKAIKFYTSNGWVLGGIASSMLKRRN